LVFAGDVRVEDFNTHVAQSMVDRLGGIDAWIANAGISPVVDVVQALDPTTWREVLDTNLTGAFLGVKAAARVMTAGASIIFTSSVIGQRSRRGLSAYAASKAGMDALVRTLALELGPNGITVNGVAPGWFDSPLAAGFRDNARLGRQITEHTALGRWGQSEDLPGIFMFLASDAARFITGAIIPVDGGYLLP
jgi:gluconate 5-dehydrogenase